MHLDPIDPGISKELALYRTHEPVATEHALAYASGCRTILDLGSNIGYYALLFLQGVQPRPRLIAVEPSSGNSRMLLKNLEANGLLDSATVLRVAISDRCGDGTLNLARESNWHTLMPADSRHEDCEEVAVLTLDALAEQLALTELDLVRMDIEGYETVVFGGMRAVLSRFRPKLIVELHPQLTGSDPIKNIIRVLEEEYGYGVDLVVDRELDYAHLKRRMTSLDFERLRHEDWRFRCFTVFMSFRRTELNT